MLTMMRAVWLPRRTLALPISYTVQNPALSSRQLVRPFLHRSNTFLYSSTDTAPSSSKLPRLGTSHRPVAGWSASETGPVSGCKDRLARSADRYVGSDYSRSRLFAESD